MSVAEFAPQTPTPEQVPPVDPEQETVPPIDVQESQLATRGVSKEVRKLQAKLEKRQQNAEFYENLGEVAIGIASADGSVENNLAPRTFMQRRAATKRIKKAEKIAHEKWNKEAEMRLYPTTGGSSRIALLKTAKARLGAFGEAKRQLASTGEGGIDLKTYHKKKEAIGGTYVYAGQLNQRKINKAHRKAVEKFAQKNKTPIMQEVRQSRINSAQRKLDQLNGVGPYDRLTEVLFPTPQPVPTEPIETPVPTPIPEPPKMSSLERLRKMREEGVLPPVAPRTTVEPESKTSTEPTPEPTVESVVAPVEETKDEGTQPTYVEKMAEIAYLTAKREIRELLKAENEQRRKEGKPQLTKEEKDEKWKAETSVRQRMLDELSPDNRDLVEQQISELEKADSKARRKKEEQLLQKRDREQREAAAKIVKPTPTATPRPRTSQRSGETVQQRARREREEKAKQKIADGQRTFSHPDIPS